MLGKKLPWIVNNLYWIGRHITKGPIMIKMPIKNNERINVWFYDEQRWVDYNRKILRSNVVNNLSIEFIRKAEKILIEKENK